MLIRLYRFGREYILFGFKFIFVVVINIKVFCVWGFVVKEIDEVFVFKVFIMWGDRRDIVG